MAQALLEGEAEALVNRFCNGGEIDPVSSPPFAIVALCLTRQRMAAKAAAAPQADAADPVQAQQ